MVRPFIMPVKNVLLVRRTGALSYEKGEQRWGTFSRTRWKLSTLELYGERPLFLLFQTKPKRIFEDETDGCKPSEVRAPVTIWKNRRCPEHPKPCGHKKI